MRHKIHGSAGLLGRRKTALVRWVNRLNAIKNKTLPAYNKMDFENISEASKKSVMEKDEKVAKENIENLKKVIV
jgi:hypothetical protein